MHPISPSSTSQTLVVVPAYNEADRLQTAAFLEAATKCPSLDFLFVNDGSQDATAIVLNELVRGGQRLHALHLERNRGKAEAVRVGLNWGFDKGYAAVAFWDADLATPLEDLPAFLARMDQTDRPTLVMGSRVKLLGRRIERNALRHYLGRIFATFVSLVLDLAVYDTQCGAKLFRNTPQVKEAFAEPFLSKWIFDVEILARLKRAGLQLENCVVELPLQTWMDVAGSKVKALDFFRASLELLRIHLKYRPRRAIIASRR